MAKLIHFAFHDGETLFAMYQTEDDYYEAKLREINRNIAIKNSTRKD